MIIIIINFSFLEFFEDTIAEEQYEAQKLDIMRDALRSKATYVIESKKMVEDETNFAQNNQMSPPAVSPSPESPSPSSLSPLPSNGISPPPSNGIISSPSNGTN